jgi:hypothetical protein
MMDDLLNAMLSGGSSQSDSDQTDGDELADLLGGILGGGAAQGGADAGDLLGAFLGAGSSQGAGGMDDLLNSFLGGGGSADLAANPLLAPIVDKLAHKLGLPPETAQVIVGFVMAKLLSGQSNRGRAQAGLAALDSQDSLDLDDLMGRVASQQGIDADYFQSSGMANELAEQAGLDPDTAARSLQEAFQMMGGH